MDIAKLFSRGSVWDSTGLQARMIARVSTSWATVDAALFTEAWFRGALGFSWSFLDGGNVAYGFIYYSS